MLTSPRQGEAPADQTLPELFWMMDHVLCPTLAMHRGIREDDRQLRFESRLELQQTRVATPHPNYRVLAMADEVEWATFTEALQRELNAIEVGTRNGQVNLAADEYFEIDGGNIKKSTRGKDSAKVWNTATAMARFGRQNMVERLSESVGVFTRPPRQRSKFGGKQDVVAVASTLRKSRYLQRKSRGGVTLEGKAWHSDTTRLRSIGHPKMVEYVETVKRTKRLLEWPPTDTLLLGADWK